MPVFAAVGVSNIASYTINVSNMAPTAANTGIYYTLKNQPLTISDLPTYGDSASTTSFTPSIVMQPMNGQLTDLGGGKYRYTPNTGYTGPDFFSYKLNDGITDSNTAMVMINVVDQAIVANDVRLPVSMLDSVVVTPSQLLANAQTTVYSPTWQVTSVGTPTLGQITPNGDGTWTYTPPANAVVGFQDSLAITISDGTNTAAANLVLLVPDPPLFVPD